MTPSRVCLAGSLILLWSCLATMEWLTPCFFLHDDNASSYIANFLLAFDSLFSTGRLAEINYYQYGGDPFMEQGQSAVLYLPTYLCVALAKYVSGDPRWTIEWLAALHMTAGQIGLFLWLRSWRMEPLLACLGSLLWILSPFVLILSSNWIAVLYIVCYMPWILIAVDRLWILPGLRSACYLALPVAFFFLTGAIQFLAYVLLFSGIYGLLNFRRRSGKQMPVSFFWTQFFIYGTESLHSGPHYSNSSYFLCVELYLLPLAILALKNAQRLTALRAFKFFVLAELGLLFSTWGHIGLSLLPIFNRFRWPFKVFIYWKLFLILFILTGLSCWIKKEGVVQRGRLWIAAGLLTVVLLTNEVVVAYNQFPNLLSHAQLPSMKADVASVVDPSKGRILAIDIFTGDGYDLNQYLAYNFSTTYRIPNLGGYDSLVGLKQSLFGLNLNLPNIYWGVITPGIRNTLNKRCVRYLIINAATLCGQKALQIDGMKPLVSFGSRTVAENTQAAAMAIYQASPEQPGPLRYGVNSVFVPVGGVNDSVGVSLSDTEGWYYRCDQGPWKKPLYLLDRVWCPVTAADHTLEITYFDPYFRDGIVASLLASTILGLGGLVLVATNRFRRAGKNSRC